MRKIENHCCDCASPGYPCRGTSCPLRSVEVTYCDRCDAQIDTVNEDVYEGVGGTDLCRCCYEELYGKEE